MPKYLTVCLLGHGDVSPKMISSLVQDIEEAAALEKKTLELVFPVDADGFSGPILDAVKALGETSSALTAYTLEGAASAAEAAAEELDQLAEIVADDNAAIAAAVENSDDVRIWIFWDDSDRAYDVAEAWAGKVPIYDATRGLEEIVFADEDPDSPDDSVPPAEEIEEEAEEAPEVSEEPEPVEEALPDEGDPLAALDLLSVAQLKELCAERGITITKEGRGRISRDAYSTALLAQAAGKGQEYLLDSSGTTTAVGAPLGYQDDPDPAEDAPEPEEEGYEDPVDVDQATGEIDPLPETGLADVEDDAEGSIPTDDEAPKVDHTYTGPGTITWGSDKVNVAKTTNQAAPDVAINLAVGGGGAGGSNLTKVNLAEGYTTNLGWVPARQPEPTVAGHCTACGGPFLYRVADDGRIEDAQAHAPKCPLA